MLPNHTRAAILSTGDELLIGQLLDTNSRYFADLLTTAGIIPLEHLTVGDDMGQLVASIRRLAESAPLLIMSGGLGPTDGDLTRHALAQVMGEPLVEDGDARAALEARLRARGREVTERQLRQARRPASARCLANANGTAPGLHARITVAAAHGLTDVYCLPGPPGELRPMFERAVLSELRPQPGRLVATRLLQLIGLGESDAVDKLAGLTARDRNPLVGITASGAVLTIRIRYEGDASRARADELLAEAEAEVRSRLGRYIFGTGADTLASAVIGRLRTAGRTVATVESCTGGLLAGMLTEVPGSSAVVVGGLVTYANALKTSLTGVPAELIEQHGAVSEPVARAMAIGGLSRCQSDHALAITGVAGPGGGTDAKPVGTVWIAHAWRPVAGGTGVPQPGVPQPGAAACDVRRFWFPGGRDDVRTRSARTALAMLFFGQPGSEANSPDDEQRGERAPKLLWQA